MAVITEKFLSSVTGGKQVKDDYIDGLVGFYYNITNCLATLTRMKYDSDLGCSEVVKRAVNCLQNRLQGKWKGFLYSIHKGHEEVTLKTS